MDTTLADARQVLRKKQEKWALRGSSLGPRDPDQTKPALQALEEQRRFVNTDNAAVVKRGTFKFDPAKETERVVLAQDLIRRVSPGAFEEPTYLALLAYQAASVEIAYAALTSKAGAQKRFEPFLLGTVAAPEVNAFSDSKSANGFTIVGLHAALIDFIYQAAKAVIEAVAPIQNPSQHWAASYSADLQKVKVGLQTNPAPAERIWRTLKAYFFDGQARVSAFERVKDEQGPALSVLVSMSERWIVAHEYGHGLLKDLDLKAYWAAKANGRQQYGTARGNPLWGEEFLADSWATTLTAHSAGGLDGLPPEFALSGGTFALTCLEVLRRSLSVLRTGVVEADAGDVSHPPNRTRAERVISDFRQFFDVEYQADGSFHLTFVMRSAAPEPHSFTKKHSVPVFFYGNVLLAMWKFVETRLTQELQTGSQLHEMWRAEGGT